MIYNFKTLIGTQNIDLESKDYFRITKEIVDIANRHSQGRVISFLEGGYDLVALGESVAEHLRGLKESKACN